ncbi:MULTISPECIES: phospholipase D family protein [unclassified Variovorax]|jgi:phosphatidylserine/phosphatidylglycerophosphate/cardiolipin synthase-like enzyme|uniref:phospholipase D family nuclease n=1 Tax=unclassified Variovorax TaxID=663243 RepID=UPI002576909B|nr:MULTISPECIES: phospholipase D family protein [unclassified Variovorax]MDM0085827.1 phospholipase D family protein [Variovorax sp. J22G40]MDM0145915.1 phospholipase D family protein [Variovorax sp. J2P1-31]
MKSLQGLVLLLAAALTAPVHARGLAVPLPAPSSGASAEVFFSPGADTDRAIAHAVDAARRRVWIAGYFFTASTIAKAVAQAHARGLDVRVLLDSSQATHRYSSATYFHNQGVPLWIDARYPVMHHKFVLVDADTVGFGSMNFTRAGAQQNAENFNLFRRWPQLAATYAQEFERLQQESEPYRPGMRFDKTGGGEDRP